MNINNLNALQIYIQENYPMFLTNDLTLYAIIGKIVTYTNSLLARMKQLENIFNNLETLTNNKLETMESDINTFISETTTSVNNFTKDITAQLNNFKTQINNDYNNWTSTQLETINTFITNTNNDLATFKTSTNNTLTALQTTINQNIASKNQEVDNLINNVNPEEIIQNYMDTLVSNGTFTEIFNSLYNNVYYLSYYGSGDYTSQQYAYYYKTNTNTLYYNNKASEVNKYGIYIYNGNLYLPVLQDNKYVLVLNGG